MFSWCFQSSGGGGLKKITNCKLGYVLSRKEIDFMMQNNGEDGKKKKLSLGGDSEIEN